jgi:CRP-like cAMP-binding protein
VTAPTCAFDQGNIIFSEQERLDHVYLVESGWVLLTSRRKRRLARHGQWWSKQFAVPIAVAVPGALVGLIPFAANELTLYSAVARGKCTFRVIDRSLMQRVLMNIEARLGSAARAVLPAPALLGTWGRQGLLLGSELFLLEPSQRVEHLLWSLTQSGAQRDGDREVILDMPFTRDELGALVHIDGKTFTRILSQLESQELIRREKHAIVLLRRDALTHVAGGADPAGVF